MAGERTIRLFGVLETTVRERLADMLLSDEPTVALHAEDGDVVLSLTSADERSMEEAVETVKHRLGAYVYDTDGRPLPMLTVALLREKKKTIAVAESCTGGLIASRLTAVPGCSAVFGTGVVSYSWDCKQQQLGVSAQTLETYGAVSAEVAREMADGVRRCSAADIGIATTGEAGPQAAEDKPVGTVFVALADAKRTWVKELHLNGDGMDREAIRRTASGYALDLVRRYLQAYPTVMAGGEHHGKHTAHPRKEKEEIPARQRLAETVLPWRGNRKRRFLKIGAWLAVFALLVVGVLMVYNRILIPITNRELQDDLAQLYWSSTSDLTDAQPNDGKYPDGMMAQFRGLYEMNEDVAGWVYIPETEINYPVTLYADGYYRNHNFNDQYSVYGQPFFYENDTRDSIRQERVLIVRGNNTRDEQMFSPLLSYRRIAYLQENPIIEMNTLYDAAQWQIFAVSVVDEKEQNGHFDYTKREFADDAAFMQYAEQLQKRSLFRSDVTLTADDSLLLLVTNAEKEYGFSGARLIVAARRITGAEPMANYTINYQMTWPAAYRLYTTTRTVLTTTSTATTTTVVSTTTSTVSTSHTTSSVTSTSTSATVTQASEQTDTTTTLPQGPSDEGEETDDTENKDDDYLGN